MIGESLGDVGRAIGWTAHVDGADALGRVPWVVTGDPGQVAFAN